MKKVTRQTMYEWDYTEDGKGGWIRLEKKVVNRKGKQSSMDLDVPADPRRYQGGMYKGQIFIPGNVISLKNSKQILFMPKKNQEAKGPITSIRYYKGGGKKFVVPFIAESDAAKKYKKNTAAAYQMMRSNFHKMIEGLEKPYYVQLTFLRASNISFDYGNMTEIVADCMVAHEWLEDDNCSIVLFDPPKPPEVPYIYNPKNPGVLIKVMRYGQEK